MLKNVLSNLRLFRFVGLRTACKLLARSLLGQKGEKISIRCTGLPSEFHIRLNTSDLDIFKQIFVRTEYQFSDWTPYAEYIEVCCKGILRRGLNPLIVDAGANIGASSIWFAQKFPSCRVFALEPDPGNFDILKQNVEHYSNVTALNCGLWDTRTNLSILNPAGGHWARRVDESPSEASIPSVTVPDLLGRDEKLRLLIAKIDIEGAETKVLQSNTEWIDEVPLVVFEHHDMLWHWLGPWQGSGHSFFSVLSRRKREYLSKGENTFAFLHPHPSPEKTAASGTP